MSQGSLFPKASPPRRAGPKPARRPGAVVGAGGTLVVLVALAAVGCGEGAAPATSAPGECRAFDIVATTSILGDVVGRVAGDGGRVRVLMPLGADPHSFQPSAAQTAALREADLVVVNGLGLEEGLGDVVAAAAAAGVAVVEAASFVEPLPFRLGVGATDALATGEAGHDAGALDPHIWTDPRRMAQVAAGLGETLAAADPGCAARRRSAAAAYRDELLALDAEIEARLAGIPPARRKLVTSHQSFGYFADRYGFEVIGVLIPGGTTLAEPSPADLAALVEVLRREGVRAVFAETTRPADLAAAVAAELGGGVRVVSLYSGSLGEPGSGAETYVGMQWVNAERIAGALAP